MAGFLSVIATVRQSPASGGPSRIHVRQVPLQERGDVDQDHLRTMNTRHYCINGWGVGYAHGALVVEVDALAVTTLGVVTHF